MQTKTLVEGLCFAEGPRWHDSRLWFSDMHDHHVYAADMDGNLETIAHVPEQPSGLGWLPDGRLLVVSMLDRKLLVLEAGELSEFANLHDLATYHCNDMVTDARGRSYVGNFGFDLHAGDKPCTTSLIMVTEDGPKVLEFNVRFGDPETQAVLMRLESDLAGALKATAEGRLDEVTLPWSTDPAVCIVMASGGYPGPYEKGHVIKGLDDAEATGAVVFHAGTAANDDGALVNSGGRVLGVTARGETIDDAVTNAYRAVRCISWKDTYYRRDIAHRALKR